MSWEKDLQAAPSDSEAAARVLGHAAGFMRRGEALPAALAKYTAKAFKAASDASQRDGLAPREVGRKLAALLNLKRKGGRPEKAEKKVLQGIYVLTALANDGEPDRGQFEQCLPAVYSSRTTRSGQWDRVRLPGEPVEAFDDWFAEVSDDEIAEALRLVEGE